MSSSPPHTFDTVIVGAGLAGIAAALELTDRGQRVALLESRRRLGGRATSFVDQTSGEGLDNCQHVTLGCCTAYLNLCDRLGVLDRFAWEKRQWWIETGGRTTLLQPGLLPAPLHYAGAFVSAFFLTVPEKLAIAAAMREIMVAGSPTSYITMTFADYLRSLDQPASAMEKFWAPVIISACNMSLEGVSAAPALKVFQDGFLASKAAGRIGVPTVPLAELYTALPEILAQRGGRVVFGEHAQDVRPGRVTTQTSCYVGRTIISALPLEKATAVVRDARGNPDARLIGAPLTFSPILGVHIECDRPVLTTPHAVLVERPTQWLFRKSADGKRFHAVISAADDWMEDTETTIVERIMRDVRACIPRTRKANVTWARAVKERRATFAATPAFEQWRGRLNAHEQGMVTLAGDYTNTGWPATMEGATLSGLHASRCVGG
jgi:squalene-associated FAD-dependent desaturase